MYIYIYIYVVKRECDHHYTRILSYSIFLGVAKNTNSLACFSVQCNCCVHVVDRPTYPSCWAQGLTAVFFEPLLFEVTNFPNLLQK